MLISFCIPTYNRAEYLKRCLNSILTQDDADIEVIVQDNCSQDRTEEEMAGFSDSRLRYYRNAENIGGNPNIISIVGKACGEYVYFLTDDAYLAPNAIDRIRTFIRENEPALFTSNIDIYLEKQKRIFNQVSFLETISLQTPVELNTMALIIYSARFIPRVCFKRALLDYELLQKHGDHWFPHMLIALQMYAKGGPILYLAEPLVTVNVENESFGLPSDLDDTHRGLVYIIKVMREYLDYEMLECFIFTFCRGCTLISEELVELLTPEGQARLKADACARKYRVI